MLSIKTANKFLKDQKLASKRGLDLDKLETVVNLLQAKKLLPAKHRDHSLSGHWNYCRECHIQPDWLLIYRIEGQFLVLERTGTHADLFD